MGPSRAMLVLLAAALPAACGGDDKKPAPPAAPGKPAESKAAPRGDSGLDLSSLQASAPVAKPVAPATAAPSASAPPAAGGTTGPAPAPGPAPAKTAEGKPAGDAPPGEKAADGKPAVPPPGSPDEIGDTEVLLSSNKEERDALNEMPEAERVKEIRKRRLEMFKDRGGVLDTTSGKMSDKKADDGSGERGPARPAAVKEA